MKYEEGARIEARFDDSDAYYAGTVTSVHRGNNYEILFDDGDVDKKVPAKDMRILGAKSTPGKKRPVKTEPISPVETKKARKGKGKGKGKKAKKQPKSTDEADEPYPTFQRPTAVECQAARDILAEMHGARPQGKPHCKYVLDSLCRTILSQNTTDTTSARAFQGLKDRNPTWEEFLECPDSECEDSIRCGGLAEIKVQRIKTILRTLKEERNELSCEYMRKLPTEEVKAELLRFKGVGPKTVACVLMFTLQRAEFPVDTHVWKIAMRLNWVPGSATRETTYEHLNRRIPDDLKFELHVLLVEHGKVLKNDLGPLRAVRDIAKMASGKVEKGEVGKEKGAKVKGGEAKTNKRKAWNAYEQPYGHDAEGDSASASASAAKRVKSEVKAEVKAEDEEVKVKAEVRVRVKREKLSPAKAKATIKSEPVEAEIKVKREA